MQATGFPPFTDIIRVLVSCENEQAALDATKRAMDEIRMISAQNPDAFIYLNAMRAPKKRIQTKHRMQILMRIKPDADDVRAAVYKAADNAASEYPQATCFTEINPNDLS